MQKLKIGFFGGCFNPPINTHISIANSLIKNKILDKVVFVPVGDYYKKQDLVPAIHRYNMLKISCENYKSVEIEDIACKHKGTLYAIDTFELIQKKYGNESDIYFIMGSDNFEKMPGWKNSKETLDKYKFIVVERPAHEMINKLENVIYTKMNQIDDITSTRIRNKLKNGENVTNWIEEKTLRYIKENKLYYNY